MNDRLYKKSLILGIVILFVGVSIVPSISGLNTSSKLKDSNEKPINLFLNNDYVNVYYKLDEGTGNTAYDSSLHGYDGTIYSATWSMDTPSGSGYSLEFDGVNDYINISAYAKNYLGINKTDDMIFSFYFKTLSTNKGIIFSQCRGDSYGYNPGFHIAIVPNGSIEVQVWRLNCGILMYSENAYNDGDWHFAEIYYNGITTNPHVELYVDGSLDNTYEKYVCSFYADQFKYADIGRHSHDLIDYYEGKLDEFKYIKYPGGNEQNPPIIDGPTYGDPGVEYDYTFEINDPEGDECWLKVNWGDGVTTDWEGPYESGTIVTLSHTWNIEELFNIKAKTKDRWHESWWSADYPVRIGNWPPYPPEVAGPKHGNANQVITYSFVTADFEDEDVYYYVEWGDGTYDDWFGPYPSGQEVTASHLWTVEDIYEIRAKAKDINDGEGHWSEYYPVSIGNHPPSSPDINGPREGKVGVEYTYNFMSTDEDGDDVLYEINWGDGDEEITSYYPEGEEVTVSHTWTSRGTYKIKARAVDIFEDDGPYKEITVTIPREKTLKLDILEMLFARFPNAFLLLKNLLKL
jgi:hypothetical protein